MGYLPYSKYKFRVIFLCAKSSLTWISLKPVSPLCKVNLQYLKTSTEDIQLKDLVEYFLMRHTQTLISLLTGIQAALLFLVYRHKEGRF